MMETTRPEKAAPSDASGRLTESSLRKSWILSLGSFLFVLLQSACTAVIAVSGIRVAIGLSSLAAAAGLGVRASGFHADWLRIPMLLLALAGAAVNLYVIWRIRSLRNKPASQWRRRPFSASKIRSENLQIVLAIGTLVLVVAETVTHHIVHNAP